MSLLHRAFARSRTEVWDTENRLLHAFRLVRRPVAVQWLVTAACDMKCPHCYSAAGKRSSGELTTEEAKRLVIDELVALDCPLLVLAGGELLLRRDIPELVDYACSRGLEWAMHTHGMHVARHRDLFERHPPVLAAISLDGDRSFHDAFRGREGSFDAALEAAAVLAEAGCREVVLGTTITRDNADRVADMFPLVVGSRAHSWGLHLFAPEGRGHDHAELFPTPGQLRRVAAFARRRRGLFPIELCNEWGSAGEEDLYYRDQPFACGAGRIACVVSATGDVLPCTTTDPAEREGNVRDTSLRELWMRSFGRFRSGSCDERGECWLQTRNGVRPAEHAFGAVARPRPLWVEQLPQRRRSHARLIGERGAAAVGLLAAGLVFLQGCTRPNGSETPTTEVRPNGSSGRGDTHWAGLPVPSDAFPEVLASSIAHQFHPEPWTHLRSLIAECASSRQQCGSARAQLEALPSSELARQLLPTVRAHVDALEQGREVGFDEALGVLDAFELQPKYDAWLAGHLWRSVRATRPRDATESRDRVRLYARLRQHHRVLDALKRAQASVGEVQVRPWLKKSMPPPDAERAELPPGFVGAALAAWLRANAATWDSLAFEVVVDGAGAELARAGRVESLSRGASVQLNRLDVLWCSEATTLKVAGDRELEIPARTEVTLFSLGDYLSPKDREVLEARVEAGDVDALEADLPLAHGVIRHHLSTGADAPALRTLLVAFDE
jgi:MoaA/NifB/PqqE/SkfB family radical SAM enzyme